MEPNLVAFGKWKIYSKKLNELLKSILRVENPSLFFFFTLSINGKHHQRIEFADRNRKTKKNEEALVNNNKTSKWTGIQSVIFYRESRKTKKVYVKQCDTSSVHHLLGNIFGVHGIQANSFG